MIPLPRVRLELLLVAILFSVNASTRRTETVGCQAVSWRLARFGLAPIRVCGCSQHPTSALGNIAKFQLELHAGFDFSQHPTSRPTPR